MPPKEQEDMGFHVKRPKQGNWSELDPIKQPEAKVISVVHAFQSKLFRIISK